MNKLIDRKEYKYTTDLCPILGGVAPNSEVENGGVLLIGNVYEKYARMHRALINWREVANGKVIIKVPEENK